VGCGGYASYFPVKAAGAAGIPYALQEQNRVPGLATRWLAPGASTIFAAFEESRRFLSGAREIAITGNPIDPRLATMSRSEARGAWGLSGDDRVVLVTGGSGGARSINSSIAAAIRNDCANPTVTVLWQTGRHKVEWDGRVGAGWVLREFEFTDRMTEAFVAADIVIARSGALTISELAAAGRPAILVPFPHATDDHQTHNARVLVDAGGAVLVPDHELAGRSLLDEALVLVNDSDGLARMSNANRMLGKPEAADRIARAVISLAEVSNRGDNRP
jgi:UDP-N-acetylglucosamine--N-acetylmuramyl-(pentapeptide) pyrophosphoryl-undecaprenol N-acetylglucosamine transferase